MNKPKKTPSYTELKKIWYKKLEKSGFKDVERNDKHENLKQYDAPWFYHYASKNPEVMIAKQEYFYNATQMLQTGMFENATEKEIWALHSDGKSLRAIAKEVGFNKDNVHAIVKKLQSRFGCKQ